MSNTNKNTHPTQNTTLEAPARQAYNLINFEGMDSKKEDFITEIVTELEKAQTLAFSSKFRYIKVGLALTRAKDGLDLKDTDWKEFHKALGLKEKVEERCRKISKNKWFAKFTEENAPKLHHLTQANMITMSKEEDEEKFNAMLDVKYDFSPTPPTKTEVDKAFKKAFNAAEFTSISLKKSIRVIVKCL